MASRSNVSMPTSPNTNAATAQCGMLTSLPRGGRPIVDHYTGGTASI